MRKYRVRQATARDITVLARQRHSMFAEMRPESKRALEVHDRFFPGWAKREMLAGRLTSFLVEGANGKVVGGGSVWLREVQPRPGFPGGKEPYLMSMYTDPNCRGKGIATLVAKHAVAWAKKRGYGSMSLHASKMGKPLYEKLGWERSSEMELDLRQHAGRSPRATKLGSRRSGR